MAESLEAANIALLREFLHGSFEREFHLNARVRKVMGSSYFSSTKSYFYCILQLFSASIMFLKEKRNSFCFQKGPCSL